MLINETHKLNGERVHTITILQVHDKFTLDSYDPTHAYEITVTSRNGAGVSRPLSGAVPGDVCQKIGGNHHRGRHRHLCFYLFSRL